MNFFNDLKDFRIQSDRRKPDKLYPIISLLPGGEDIQVKGSRYSGNGVFHGNNQHRTPKTSAHHLQEGHQLMTREIKS